MCIWGPFYKVKPFMDPPACVQSFPLKESWVFAEVVGINERYFSSSVNHQQMTECCDRPGALLYKQPSWRENAVAPALLLPEGEVSYCRCRHILTVSSTTLTHKWTSEEWESCQMSNISSVLWSSVINKHAIACYNHIIEQVDFVLPWCKHMPLRCKRNVHLKL